jgi:carboxylesterase type B
MDSFDFPHSTDGYREAGVSIVDGVTVVAGLEQAFSDNTSGRIIDVPLLIGSTSQEIEMCPPHDWRGVSQEQFMSVLNHTFAPWGQQAVRGVQRQYATEIAECSQLAFASIMSDMRFTCGNIELAQRYATSMASPVYSYVVSYRPSHPWRTLPCTPSYSSPFSFHKLDLLAATGNFNFFRDFGAATQGYDPEEADLAFGAMLRRAWYSFARSGQIHDTAGGTWRTVQGPGSAATVDSPSGDERSTYWVNDVGSRVTATPLYKAEVCGFWRASGFDERFWICD